MDVEQPTLSPGSRRGFRFIYRRLQVVPMKDTREDEAAKAGTDDSHILSHDGAPWIAAPIGADVWSGDAGQPCDCTGRRVRGYLRSWCITRVQPFFATTG
jgi:hypothetical protein